ncbi:hypothetical protein CAI21_20925 [Alkalilimnicola ehrlichii]|uniref:Porin domain-containing protein n=1 Tax=Alkalilimnicola ehrlichii TaxID=351052 RepID=A0A3E0WHM5_9GAMM|nr:hypothetical protein [Alkalilimnicola ehrlichii]RFA24619.1 hypothetical protein CAI21_20925 [Alkalilimnicola ehrlichii]RFA31733.1 hypothetical protein CAL65_21625 [Alkalilimnicola ehrlichii]
MPKQKLTALAAAALVLAAPGAHASDWLDSFQVRGFGTVGFTYSDEKEADFVTNFLNQPGGAGQSEQWGHSVDTKYGLQLDARFNEQFSAVVQAIVQQQYDDEFRPDIEWANLRYQVSNDFSLRAGRIVAPTNMLSDSRNVGYAHIWARPPIEVYAGIPFTNLDGADATYRTRFAGTTATFQIAVGGSEMTYDNGGALVESEVEGFAVNGLFERGRLGVRLGYTQVDLDVPAIEAWGDGMRAIAGDSEASRRFADRYASEGTVRYYSLGATYERGNWLTAAELMYSEMDAYAFANDTSGYLSVGYRMGAVTPFAVAGFRDSDTMRMANADDYAVAPGQEGNRDDLVAAVNRLVAMSDNSQTSITLGARWDFAPGMALKVQGMHAKTGSNSSGILTNASDAFEPGKSYNLFTANVDFVF